ncbi:hypothetical protein CcrBL47_gp389 [Caulobacter phage BL47]|nr:hypothetical protein CcrBL47_gp389 [Caulobacter phage BL47]
MTGKLSITKAPASPPPDQKAREAKLHVHVFNDDGLVFSGTLKDYVEKRCADYYYPLFPKLGLVVADAIERFSDILVTEGPLTRSQLNSARKQVEDSGDECWRVACLSPFTIEEVDIDEDDWDRKLARHKPAKTRADLDEEEDEDDVDFEDDEEQTKPLWLSALILVSEVIMAALTVWLLVNWGAVSAVVWPWAVGLWHVLGWGLWIAGGFAGMALLMWLFTTEDGHSVLGAIMLLAFIGWVLWAASMGLYTYGQDILAKEHKAAAHASAPR